MTTLMELRASPHRIGYAQKQLHAVPKTTTVNRAEFLLERCRGQSVLDIGASGEMHEAIRSVATEYHGLDFVDKAGVHGMDLDDVGVQLPNFTGVNLVVCGEVLEHLTNPGHLLKRLWRQYWATMIVTVPNAFSDASRRWMQRGIENVNLDHCCWYSYHTLKALLCKSGYSMVEWHWYNGRPLYAEGLIAVCQAQE